MRDSEVACTWDAWNQEEMDRAFLRVQIRQANALEHIANTLERIYKHMPTVSMVKGK